jgi:hypothetical protein
LESRAFGFEHQEHSLLCGLYHWPIGLLRENNYLHSFYWFINTLSIDIAIGAVISAAFFAKVLQVDLTYQAFVALGLTVWIIYTTDHLLDARKLKENALTIRHKFHQRNFKYLFVLVMIMSVADMVMITYIRKPVFVWGIVLAAVVIIYLIMQHFLLFLKEIFAAILYSSGVIMPALVQVKSVPSHFVILLMVEFFVVVFMNLLLFSWFDRHIDFKQNSHSFVVIVGGKATEILLTILAFFNIGVGGFLILSSCSMSVPSLIILSMTALLVFIFLFQNYFAVHDRYRFLGDAIFLLPAIYLMIN